MVCSWQRCYQDRRLNHYLSDEDDAANIRVGVSEIMGPEKNKNPAQVVPVNSLAPWNGRRSLAAVAGFAGRCAMHPDDPLDLKRVDQEIRVNELKEEARELAGGDMLAWEDPDCPPGLAEDFWNHVVAFEKAPRYCDFLRLQDLGVELPEPVAISDEELPGKLHEIFETLARHNTYFVNTDHYSDRELYTHLWEDTLREVTVLMPSEAGFNCTYDLVSSGSAEDIHAWLKYYADEETRQQWAKDFLEDVIPPHEDQAPPAHY
jgi:hypothetical protein